MEGKVLNRNGKTYVLYVYNEYAEPYRQFVWWRIHETRRDPYSMRSPEDGDLVRYQGNGVWKGEHGGTVVTGDGKTQAETTERVSVQAPLSGGKELRWNDGRWQKLMARGWVDAGEYKQKQKKPRGKAKLEREIAETLAKKR